MSAEWHFLVTLNEQMRPLKDPLEIQELAVRLLGEHLQANRVNYEQIEGTEYVVRRSYASGVEPFSGRGPLSQVPRTIADGFRRGETVVITDTHTDARVGDAERAQLLGRKVVAYVGVPLTKEGRWVAAFGIHSTTPRDWTTDQIALIELTAERTWAIGERARAEESLNRINDRQAFLQKLNEVIRPLADPARILEETCRLLGTYLRVNRVSYGEIHGDECIITNDYVDGLASQAGRFQWTELGGSRIEEILQGRTMFVNDTSIEAHTAAERESLQAQGIGAYICPLLVKDGQFVASFGVHSREPRMWTTEEIGLVQDVADRIWATLEHRKAEAELRANKDRLEFLLRLSDALRPLGDPAEVQETAARLVGEHLDATRVGYAEFDGGEYTIRGEYTRDVPPIAGQPPRMLMNAQVNETLQRDEVLVVNDVHTDPRFSDSDRAAADSRRHAAFIIKALFKGGRIVARFAVSHLAPRVWTAGEIELVRDVAARTWEAVERTRAQAALHAQKLRLRLALEASAGGSWTWVRATNQVDWDDRFRVLYGFSPDEPAAAGAWLTRVHEDDRPQLIAVLDEMMSSRTKELWENTFRVVRPDGTVTWIQSRGRADRDADGNVTRLTGLDLDFSRHRQAEEALQARREEEHDRTLRTLLETARQGIVSVDDTGVIVTANNAFDAMFGWPSGRSIGRPIEPLMPSAFREGYDRRGGLHLLGVRREGSTFPIEVSVNRVQTANGPRAFAFVTDITDRQRVASALQQRSAELEYRTTQLSRMASDLTLAEQHTREQIARTLHDGLQQLLVITGLNLEQLVKHHSDRGIQPHQLLLEARHHLEEAIGAARSLNFELFPPVLQQSGLPAALAWLANWTHDKYKVPVRVVADPRADSQRKDVRTLLFESVRELIFNAIKHAQAERVSLALALDEDDQLRIDVSDDGVGFEPAGLAERSRAGELGWGLFSIRERLTLLGGSFEIDSAPGRGTRVRLVAPRGSAQVPEAAAAVSMAAANEIASADVNRPGSPGALRILLVDDHAGMRSALREMLDEHAELCVVGYAANGLQAIAQAHALRPEVILMDVAMPQMDGIEATRRIRAELADIQILGLSMQPRNAVADAMEQAGADGFYVKGIDTQRLIKHLLAVHALRVARTPAKA